MDKRIFYHIAERAKRISWGNGENYFKSSFGREDVPGYFPKEKFKPSIKV
jgi:hypothetical protein